jgi:hypothetical protein
VKKGQSPFTHGVLLGVGRFRRRRTVAEVENKQKTKLRRVSPEKGTKP